MYLPNSTWTWTFLLIALFQCIISLVLESYVFGRFQESLRGQASGGGTPPSPALTIPTYLAVFIFGFLYELGLVYDALRLKNTIQVIGICLYNFGMLIYASVEIHQVDVAVGQLVALGDINPRAWFYLRPILISGPCVIALGTILLSFVAWKLYDEFAWTIYKHISADLRLKRRYLVYQIYIALLKFDFFFFLGFTVQFLVVVTHTSDAEFYLTIAAVPITIVLLFLAAYFTRRESYAGQVLIIVVYFAAMAYFIFKLVRMYDSSREADYAPARPSLTTFAVITILLLLVTITASVLCMRNFHKGLAPHIRRRKVPEADDVKYSNHYGAAGQYPGGGGMQAHQLGDVPSRMTID